MKSDILMTGWSSNGIFENTVLALAWRDRGKPQKNQFELWDQKFFCMQMILA
jgi:hypothetical protein